jgi:hypothetical protein
MDKDVNKVAKTREDEYFARHEFERLKRQAEERVAMLKAQEHEDLKQLHWMRCPKDGHELIEIQHLGVAVDKCSHCGGVFLDAGELERLLDAEKEQEGMLGRILHVFR